MTKRVDALLELLSPTGPPLGDRPSLLLVPLPETLDDWADAVLDGVSENYVIRTNVVKPLYVTYRKY